MSKIQVGLKTIFSNKGFSVFKGGHCSCVYLEIGI
jgi:hypothetical protein